MCYNEKMKKIFLVKIPEFLREHLIFPVKLFFRRFNGVFHPTALFKKDSAFIYVALGDSTVEGHGASHRDRAYPSIIYNTLKLRYPKAEYYNFGQGGARVEEVAEKQLHEAVVLNPNLITLSIGANDIASQTKISDFETRLEYILSKLTSNTKAHIVINSIPDLSATTTLSRFAKIYGNYRIGLFNKIIETLSEKYNIQFVDLYLQSRIFARNYPEVLSHDGLHPSDTGYALWANTIITQIQPHLFK